MATWVNQTKDSASWAMPTADISAWVDETVSFGPATGGLYYGFGAFTYSGGQSVGRIPWANQSKN